MHSLISGGYTRMVKVWRKTMPKQRNGISLPLIKAMPRPSAISNGCARMVGVDSNDILRIGTEPREHPMTKSSDPDSTHSKVTEAHSTKILPIGMTQAYP